MTVVLALLARIWWLFPMMALAGWGSFEHLRYDDARVGNAKAEAKQAQAVQAAKDAAAAEQKQAAKAARDAQDELQAQLLTANAGLDAAVSRLRDYAARAAGPVPGAAQAASGPDGPAAGHSPTSTEDAGRILRAHEWACEWNSAIAEGWQKWYSELASKP